MKIFLRKFFTFYLLLTSINSLDYDGYFKIISYNVGGLPEIISSSKPSKYTKLISPRLNKYDIVNVQEDFGYNDDLISLMEHEYRTEFSGNVPFGNGLMTFSKYPLFNYRRLKWKDTHGFIVDGADQMIPKGFTYNSVEIKPGFSIDIYNIHTDADTDEKSMACRRSNMAQLGEFIKNASAGKAVIVFGDTNSRYTREGDDFDKLVVNPCNLTDAWIQNIMKGEIPPKGPPRMVDDLGELGEVVDKIWFRSGKNIELNATTFKLHLTGWTDKDGKQLSDHYPITSNIGYILHDNILTSRTFGGDGGIGFSFLDKVGGKLPETLLIGSGNRINKIGLGYVEHGIVKAGGNGGFQKIYIFKKGEYITSMTVCQDIKGLFGSYRISYINIKTNLNNQISAGKYNNNNYNFEAPNGYAIVGFFGFAGDEIDRIGCIYQKL